MAKPVTSTCSHVYHEDPALSVTRPDPAFTFESNNSSSRLCASSLDLTSTNNSSDTAIFSHSSSELSLCAVDSSLFSSLQDSQYSRDEPQDKCTTEIELVSVSQPHPQIPHYRLRIDPCTAFVGYKNKDFSGARRAVRRLFRTGQQPFAFFTGLTTIPSVEHLETSGQQHISSSLTLDDEADVASSEEDDCEGTLGLTSEQIERALDYFLLCGLRVSQMAKTYEDLEAITHLLEEKQNDLELAAKIGKTLLDKNRDLERRLSETERKLAFTEDTVSQLRHNLSVKDSLLQIYSHDHPEEPGTENDIIPDCLSSIPEAGLSSGTSEDLSLASVNFSQLNRKVRELEEENLVLLEERNRLTATADQLDEHEGALIRDCARQLVSANVHIRTLSDELAKKSDAYLNQQSEITRLLTRGLDLESRVKQLTAENELLANRLRESQAAQLCLSNEVCHLRDKYDECLSLFNEARTEVRALRKRSRRAHLRSSFMSSPTTLISGSSLLGTPLGQSSDVPLNGPCSSEGSSSSSDLTANAQDNRGQCSLASDLALTAVKDQALMNCERLFRAMDQARTARHRTGDNGTGCECLPDDAVSSSGFFSGSEPSENPFSARDECSRSRQKDRQTTAASSKIGCISTTRSAHAELTTPTNSVEDSIKRHSWFGDDPNNRAFAHQHFRNSLDDSILSSDPSVVYSMSCSRLPQRLQLIKPVEGSEVLQHWQRLATPSFTRALFEDPLPLVQNRAGVASVSSFLLDTRPDDARRNASGVPGRSKLAVSGAQVDGCAISNLPGPAQCAFNRFGTSLPGQLTSSSFRSRSLENVQPTFPHNLPSHLVGMQPPRASSPTPFSLTSLVSALLPFPLSGSQTPSGRPRADELAKVDVCAEPVRIRSNSSLCSRGLLDVNVIDKTIPTTLQRVPAVASRGDCAAVVPNLPAAQPPPHHVAPGRPVFPRTIRNTNLSGITEESSSPPKPPSTTNSTSVSNDGVSEN